MKSEPLVVEKGPKREDITMTQVHKRFTAEQVKILFQGYCQGNLSRPDVEEMLGIGKTRFFALLKTYRQDPDVFSIAYLRSTQGRLSGETENQIKQELLRDKALIDDEELPIHDYNYAAPGSAAAANAVLARWPRHWNGRRRPCLPARR